MVAVAIGGSIGLLAGGIGGRVEGALMRVVDVFLAIPSILLAIAIISLVGQGAWQVVVAVGVGYAATYARILRGSLVAVREAEFVAAARSIGAPPSRLILRHMLPNALSPLVVASTLGVATAVLDVAALGFLGLGAADPRIAEWGAMLSDSTELLRRAPYVLLAPGVAIVVSAIGFTLLGDGLREALDPRAR
ncbi:MAG TPA: ABC transporter permease [Candidatus Limnocylindrales bacterium]|nr:ABC transporter permease [Candidatus Limnocylindrales bacterium]